MPTQTEIPPRAACAHRHAPNAALQDIAGVYAVAVARVWPRPHAAYFAADPARRHLAHLIAHQARGDFADLAEALEYWSLRRLIAAYLPEAPDGLAEALRKIDAPEPWWFIDYKRLLVVLGAGGAGAKTLRHAARITAPMLVMLEALPPELRRPRILAQITLPQAAQLIARGARRVAGVDDPRAMARLADRLARARSAHSLFRMLIDEIGVEHLAPPPIPGADWLKPIASRMALESAALRFQNCLAGRIPWLLMGRGAYYEVIGDEPAIVEIVRDVSGLWAVGDVRGHANVAISAGLWTRVRAHLEQHGARVARSEADQLAVALVAAAGW